MSDKQHFRDDQLITDPEHWLDVSHHDDPERHRFGLAFLTPGPPKVSAVVASAGQSDTPAREDHVHSSGDWVDDHTRNPIVNNEQAGFGGSRGNAVVISQYKILGGDTCWWYGHYIIGSTTAWAAVNLDMFPPIYQENSTFSYASASMTAYGARAYNGSYYGLYFEITQAPGTNWQLYRSDGAPNARITNAVPFAWGAGNILSWNLKYRIA